MPETIEKTPKAYRRSFAEKVVEGLRYGGGMGQWSWLLHRVTGVGILLFLTWHIIDTFFVVAFPGLYDHTVAIYGGVWFDGGYYWPLRWGFRLGELGLIACVLFHAINGVGVILYDLWNHGTENRRPIQRGVIVVFWLLFLPATAAVLYPLRKPPEHVEDVQTDIRPALSTSLPRR